MTSISNIINYTDFNPINLKFTKLEENDRSNGQLVGYPRYNKDGVDIPLEIQLPRAKTSGIPQLNQFYKTDVDRSHIKIYLDPNNPEVVDFANKIKEIDRIMSSPEMMETLLGKKAKKYKYSPLYREYTVPEEDSEEEEVDKKKKVYDKPSYIKLKLRLSYPDKKIESKVFLLEKSTDNKKIRTKVDTSTIDDFASYIRYNSTVRAVMKPFKMWAHPQTKKDPEYGISCRLERIEVDKDSISGYKSVYDSDRFIDSDEENEDKVNVNNLKITNDSSDDSSDDDKIILNSNVKESIEENIKNHKEIVNVDSDDSDEEVIIKPPPKKGGKRSSKI